MKIAQNLLVGSQSAAFFLNFAFLMFSVRLFSEHQADNFRISVSNLAFYVTQCIGELWQWHPREYVLNVHVEHRRFDMM